MRMHERGNRMTDIIKEEEREKFREKITNEHPCLMCKDLFEMITERELDKLIVGEIEARKVIFLCSVGMLVKNAAISSYNLLVNDVAGAGKDFITSNTLKVIPKFRYLRRTRISPTVFTYWHNAKAEPNWSWEGKTLYLEDVSNAVLNSEVFKVMCSSGSHATIVKDQRAVDIKINGKPVIIVTSATANPNPELVRRFTILNLDSGINQTEEIMDRHCDYAGSGESPKLLLDFENALGMLTLVKVRIPFSDKLKKMLPSHSVIMRTHILRFLDYIKASAALYQWQRKVDKNGFILAEEQDYRVARCALLETTSNKYMIPLTKDQRKILDVFEKLGDYWFTVSDIEPKIKGMSDKWLRLQLDKLVSYELLEKDNHEEAGSSRKCMVYHKVDVVDIVLPESL